MFLEQTSDDSLARILHFLSVENVMRLMAIGSKRLTHRVVHNTTNLVFEKRRPGLFPFSLYRSAFPRLQSLVSVLQPGLLMKDICTFKGEASFLRSPCQRSKVWTSIFHLRIEFSSPMPPIPASLLLLPFLN